MADFGDPTVWLRLLADREDRELRKQALAQQQMQQQMDNAFRAEGRAMDIAESIERKAVSERQQRYYDFNLQVAQYDFNVKQKNKPLEDRLNQLNVEKAELDVQTGKARLADIEADTQLAALAAPMAQGVATALGESPTIETLARTAWGMDKVVGFAERHVPARLRAKMSKEGFRDLLSTPIVANIEGRAKSGDLEMSGAILGVSPFSGVLAPFVTDEARTAARAAGNRALSGIGSQITALPSAKSIADNFHTFGDADIAIQQINTIQAAGAEAASQLSGNLFMLPEFSGDATRYALAYQEKNEGWNQLKADLGAGAFVVNTGAGVYNESQRRGVNIISKGLVNDVLASTNPAEAVERLGTFVENAKMYPSESMAILFDAANLSTDPLATLRASMAYDKIYGSLPEHKRTDLTNDVMKIPGLYERLLSVSAVRKTRMQEEMTALSSGDRQTVDQYAATVFGMSDASLKATRMIAEEAQIQATGTDAKTSETMADVSGNSEEARRNRTHYSIVRAEQMMGSNAKFGWFGSGLKEYYDTSTPPARMKDDFATALIQVKAENEGLSDTEVARIAGDKVKARWIKKGWVGNTDEPDPYHPIHLAASYGNNTIDPDLAGMVGQYQLQTEYLDRAVTADGEPARYRLEDVQRKVTFDTEGRPFAYYITDRSGAVVGLNKEQVAGREPAPKFTVDISKEALIRVAEETRYERGPKFVGLDAFDPERARRRAFEVDLHQRIVKHLGPEWPDEKKRIAEIDQRNAERRAASRKVRVEERLPAKVGRMKRHNPKENERLMRESAEYREAAGSGG